MAERAPSADPFRDTDVIDSRAPRFSQAVTGTVALLGAIFGWPLAWALMSAQILMGLTLGRQYCLPCLAYFKLVQPRFGEGPLEDSRPPRLANVMGTTILGLAAAAWWLGAGGLATALGLLVAGLALLAATTGFCAGCADCRVWEKRLSERERPLVKLDVRERPDLARKYGITVVPTVFSIAADGS